MAAKKKVRTELPYERTIQAILHRPDKDNGNGTKIVWSRTYKHMSTAAPKAVQMAIKEGQVGDVVEFSHMLTGLQYGTCKITTKGIKIDKPEGIDWDF